MAGENQSAFRGYRPDQIGIGKEGNTSKVNEPGVYWDPASDKFSEVFHPSGADALVRMGWVLCDVKRDEETGEITKIIKPNYGGRRPEDSEEVLELRRKLAAAEKELSQVKESVADVKVKEPKTPKVTVKKEGK